MTELRVEPDQPTRIKTPLVRLPPCSPEEASRLRVEIQLLEEQLRYRSRDLDDARERALTAIDRIQQQRTDLAILELTDLVRQV